MEHVGVAEHHVRAAADRAPCVLRCITVVREYPDLEVRRARQLAADPLQLSQLHADVVFLLLGLTIALLVALHATDSPDRVRRAARDLLIVQLAQGLVGYVQYFTDLPVVLVLVHMLGAVLITACTARLVWSVRGPASERPIDSPAQPAAARH